MSPNLNSLVVLRNAAALLMGLGGVVPANAELVSYELKLEPSPSRDGGTGILKAEVTGSPETSAIISLDINLAQRHFGGFLWVADERFDSRDLLGFQLWLCEGTEQSVYHGNPLPMERSPELTYPAIMMGDVPFQTYAIFQDGGNSDLFEGWSMSRLTPQVPEGGSSMGFFILGSVVMTLFRRAIGSVDRICQHEEG